MAKLFTGEQLPPAGRASGARPRATPSRRSGARSCRRRTCGSRAGGTVRGLSSGCTFKLGELSARRPERRASGAAAPTTGWSIPSIAPAIAAEGESYRVELVVAPTALPYRPPRTDAAAGDARAADGDGGRAGGRGDLHRRVCPGEGAVPLGPARQEGREQLLLRAGLADLGGRRLGLHPDPAHRPGGDRRLHRGRPGPADHHRPGLQRRPDAALRPAGQRDAVGLEVELLARAAAATTS